jgi:hypothetical protein
LTDGTGREGVADVAVSPNRAMRARGVVVEVLYLYALPGGSLHQPVYLGRRHDVDVAACGIHQLNYCAGAGAEGG